MPAKSDFSAQPELGSLQSGYRSKFGVRGAGGNGLRSTRASGSENVIPRSSPRLGTCTGANNSRPLYPMTSTRHHGSTFGTDITNITGKTTAGKVDKPNLKPLKPLSQSQQLSQPQQLPQTQGLSQPQALSQPQQLSQPPVLSQPQLPECPTLVVTSPLVVEAPAAEPAVNVQAVEEYLGDIKQQLFQEEATFLPRADYMEMQHDLTPKMRMILMDWLIEVHMKYKLCSETLQLTVNLIDRHLTKMPVPRKKLQLVGVVAMFIASKFEEITPPELHDWVYITDKAYTKEDVLVMECTMLTTLSFQIMVPTTAHFFPAFAKANDCNSVHRHLAQYIIELGLLDIRMLQHKPSHTVSAALLLSNELLLRKSVWPPSMSQQTRCTEPALRGCVELLRQLLEADRAGAGGQLQAVHKKYSMKERHGVATMRF